MMEASFFAGASFATFAGAGVFFLKFWRASNDRFYLLFCSACWLLALERVVLQVVTQAQSPISTALTEANSWVYLIRLAAFVMILFAVIEKSRSGVKR